MKVGTKNLVSKCFELLQNKYGAESNKCRCGTLTGTAVFTVHLQAPFCPCFSQYCLVCIRWDSLGSTGNQADRKRVMSSSDWKISKIQPRLLLNKSEF